jgi:hypothetical protein
MYRSHVTSKGEKRRVAAACDAWLPRGHAFFESSDGSVCNCRKSSYVIGFRHGRAERYSRACASVDAIP